MRPPRRVFVERRHSTPPPSVPSHLTRASLVWCATGTWDLAAVAALVPGKSQAAVLASVPAGAPADAWATALMLAVLKLHFAAKSAEWKILARKGRRGLTAALGAATADVVAAAEAFVVG